MSLRHFVIGSFVGIGVMWGMYEVAYWNKIYPGVRVAEIKVGNTSLKQAEEILAELQTKEQIVLVWGTSRWIVKVGEISLEYDASLSGQRAYGVGRSGNWIQDTGDKIRAWREGVNVEPVFGLEENRLIEAIASVSGQINIPTREPEVGIVQGGVVVSGGENGQEVDERELLGRIRRELARADGGDIEVPVRKLQPQLSEAQMQTLRGRAEKVLGKKMMLASGGEKWEVGEEQIVSWLDDGGWKQMEIEGWVAQLAAGIDRRAENALFNYVGSGKVQEFQPAREGVQVKQDELTGLMVNNLIDLEKDDKKEAAVEIPVIKTEPVIKTAEVNNLGITELIGRGESDYTGSIANRVFNLKKAAGYMNGILVAPGEVFSFNKYVGDISPEGGYKQAYVIKEGRTVLGDGGGVCQVSTTLFRAVLNAGLPVEERTAHAYRVHYYENDSQPGFDATIFTPTTDFKFKNDTPTYVLVQTRVDEARRKLVFELYGTSDGRKATLSKAKVWDVTPPPPDLYQDDPTLPVGTVKQVDWKAWGAKVTFDWKVTRGDEVLQERTFYSNFRPWQAVYLRGTK